MDIPAQFVVEDAAMATDGGSIALGLRAELGQPHGLLLTQHRLPVAPDSKRLPGRLYFDGELVPIRSAAEGQIVARLRRAQIVAPSGPPGQQRTGPGMVVGDDIEAYLGKVVEGPAAAVAHLVAELIVFVESDDYAKRAAE